MSDFSLRVMTAADVPAGMELAAAEGWNQTEAGWRRLLSLSSDGCFVAESGGKTIATIVTTPHGRTVAWIGEMLVHPDFRRRGIATALLKKAILRLRSAGIETIKLDATAAGREVYRGLGFQDEYEITRCVGRLDQMHESELVRPLNRIGAADLDAVLAFDAAIFGADRSALLRALVRDDPTGACLARDAAGEVAGYVLVRPGPRAAYIGPWAAVADEPALNLLYQALAAVGTDQQIFVDIPERCPGAAVLLEPFGFRSARACTRMFLGPNRNPGRPEHVYAVSGFETG